MTRIVDFDVVHNDIPLLISKPTMTKIEMKLDFLNHEVTVGNQRIKLECNKSGHYVLPLLPLAHGDCKVIFHLESLVDLSKSEKEKKAVKLHRQFCHPSKERFLNLLKNANCMNKDFLNNIESCTDSCKFCCKYKKAVVCYGVLWDKILKIYKKL